MKRGSIFELDGVPRLREACPLALQHVVAMIVGCVTPAIIVAGAAAGGLNFPGPCNFDTGFSAYVRACLR